MGDERDSEHHREDVRRGARRADGTGLGEDHEHKDDHEREHGGSGATRRGISGSARPDLGGSFRAV